MSEIIEMLWGCTLCGAQRNRGRFKTCENCGAPRTASSPEFMPDDVQAAPAVTDGALLEKFTAGPDWKCRYCGSSAFRADGCCDACGSPQDDSTAEERRAIDDAVATSLLHPPAESARMAVFGALAALAIGWLAWFLLHERVYDVRVTHTSWRATVHIDRYAVHHHESFAERVAPGAFGQTPLGQRHHHDERILDHYVPVPYTVDEFAGYRSQSYTTSEPCGQSCYQTARTCTSNRNGSATCTGGGTRCTTRYCSVSKTRQVPYTRPVVHIRQDPVYRHEPRFAEWYAWQLWEWGLDHDVTRSGENNGVAWPAPAELQLSLGDGERQREKRELALAVSFSSDAERFEYTPATALEFAGLPVGSKHRVRKPRVGDLQVVDEGSPR